MKWEILDKSASNTSLNNIIETLLKNRGIIAKTQFFKPVNPKKIEIEDLNVDKKNLSLAIKRIKAAKKQNELVFIYGDYDADGICATAILWENLNRLGLKVLPHIPDRFEEGYGINPESVEKLKAKHPDLKLIITVDNGIVAFDGIKKAVELGVDVIVIDHHVKGEQNPDALAVVHTVDTSGSGLAWFFAKEVWGEAGKDNVIGLELSAIGTVADQLSLTGANRSLVKFGLEELNFTKRPGLLAVKKESGITKIGVYEVGFIIAPRINAMGRLKHGIESLRLICTRDPIKAARICSQVSTTNSERQKIVEDVVNNVRKNVTSQKVIVLADESYHEGVIGLAAGKLVEEYYRPAIVISIKGSLAKASARSISGFNIIEAIRSLEDYYIEGGGHAMAAGFTIHTDKIGLFTQKINEIAAKLITDEVLEKKLKIDCELKFRNVSFALLEELKKFEPFGIGNPSPVFVSRQVDILEAKKVGRENNHLKLKLSQNGTFFDGIWFNVPDQEKVIKAEHADIAYQIEENVWNNSSSLQLKIKDVVI